MKLVFKSLTGIEIFEGMSTEMETYLSPEKLAGHLGIAVKTVRKWVLQREIPYYKLGKVIRFRLSEIEEWIDRNKQKIVSAEAEESSVFVRCETETGTTGEPWKVEAAEKEIETEAEV